MRAPSGWLTQNTQMHCRISLRRTHADLQWFVDTCIKGFDLRCKNNNIKIDGMCPFKQLVYFRVCCSCIT